MAAYWIPEEAETGLWRAEMALRALSHALAAADDAACEIGGGELAALLDLVREEIAQAREAARFDARAG